MLVRGPNILQNVIVSGYVTFYQINKLYVNVSFFIIDKMSSRAGFSLWAIIWRPLG